MRSNHHKKKVTIKYIYGPGNGTVSAYAEYTIQRNKNSPYLKQFFILSLQCFDICCTSMRQLKIDRLNISQEISTYRSNCQNYQFFMENSQFLLLKLSSFREAFFQILNCQAQNYP